MKTTSKFSLRDKIGYMFGDFGNDFYFVTVGTFLTVFYTDVLGISGTVIGLLFLIARFWDGITDIMMGRLIDTSKPAKDGKFRPWIRRMAIPLAISGILLFAHRSAICPCPCALPMPALPTFFMEWPIPASTFLMEACPRS